VVVVVVVEFAARVHSAVPSKKIPMYIVHESVDLVIALRRQRAAAAAALVFVACRRTGTAVDARPVCDEEEYSCGVVTIMVCAAIPPNFVVADDPMGMSVG
jgi:hypothetical protein